MTIRGGLSLALGAVFSLLLLISLLAGLQYDQLGQDLELMANEAVPLVVQSRNLAMANNSLETVAEKIGRAESKQELSRLAEFAGLANQRLHDSLLEMENRLLDPERLKMLNLVQRQIGDLLPELQLAVQNQLDLREAQRVEIELLQAVGAQSARKLSQQLYQHLQTGIESAQHQEERLALTLLDLQRQLLLLFSGLERLDSLAAIEELRLNFQQLSQRYQSGAQQLIRDDARRGVDRFAGKLLASGQDGHDLFRQQEKLVETQGRIAALLDSSAQLSAQFRLLTTAIVNQSGEQIQQVREDALQDISQRKGVMLAMVVLALSSSIVLIWYLGHRRLARPLELLSGSVRSLEAGEYNTLAPLQGFLEVQELSQAFNRMAGSLAARDRQLQQLQHLLRNVIDSLASALIAVDAKGKMTLWNRQATKECALDPQQPIGLPLSRAISWLPLRMGRIEQAVKQRQQLSLKGLYVERSDGRRCYELTVYPLLADTGSGAVLRIEDVTDRNRIEKMVAQSEKMMSVGGLAAGIAHEINNPLAGILQSVQVLMNRLDSKFAKNLQDAEETGTDLEILHNYLDRRGIYRLLDGIRGAASQAAQIVHNMLAFSRTVPEQREAFEAYHLTQLLDQTVDLLASDYNLGQGYDFRRVKIIRDYLPEVPKIPCAGALIQQVFFNMLKNSGQALSSNAGGIAEPCITLRVSRHQKMVRVEIADNGPGMPATIRDRVFEPFFTTKSIGKGTGLGMSVSYFIVTEYHHGSIEVESEPGQGTKFIIQLPLEIAVD